MASTTTTFYSMLDAVDYAMERILAASSPILSVQATGDSKQTKQKPNPKTVVSETGHPSKGGGQKPKKPTSVDDGPVNTVDNARIYNNKRMRIVKTGTPRNPGQAIETYIFAMYDENLKPGPAYERHFGIFLPNGQPKYPLRFR